MRKRVFLIFLLIINLIVITGCKANNRIPGRKEAENQSNVSVASQMSQALEPDADVVSDNFADYVTGQDTKPEREAKLEINSTSETTTKSQTCETQTTEKTPTNRLSCKDHLLL